MWIVKRAWKTAWISRLLLLTGVLLAGSVADTLAAQIEKVNFWAVRDPQNSSQLALANRLGYFKEAGLEVQINWVTSFSDLYAPAGAEQIDFTVSSVNNGLRWNNDNIPMKYMAILTNIAGGQGVAINPSVVKKPAVRRFCDTMRQRVNLELIIGRDPETAVSEADVVTTITGSREPVFDGRWLRPGVHVNAAGSNFADKREIDATAVQRANRIVVDDVALARIESGDLLSAEVHASLDWNSVQALCQVVASGAPARRPPDEITLFESHGLGLEDLAVAARVLELARAQGIGIEIPIR